MIPRARFQIAARVIGNKPYHWDWQSEFVPLDLALAWGELADPNSDEWVDWEQSGRWLYFSWRRDGPYTGDYINLHSTNIHIIPATDELATALKRVEENDLVLLEGLLVDVEALKAGATLRANTSLSRSDSGAAACEIFYVERLVVAEREYQ